MPRVDELRLEAHGEREIRALRSFGAPRGRVFRAWTVPELVQRWMLGPGNDWTMPVCEIDLRVGGAYHYEWRHRRTGERMGATGHFLEVIPEQRWVATERFDPGWFAGTALVTVTFQERGGVTWVTQRLEYESRDARDAVLRSPMEKGLRAGWNRVEELLNGGA